MEEDSRAKFLRLVRERYGPVLRDNFLEHQDRELRHAMEQYKREYGIETPAPAAPEAQPVPANRKRKARGTSAATDAKALEAYRLYFEEGLTQPEIAELKAVTPKTVGRWLKRARELQNRTK